DADTIETLMGGVSSRRNQTLVDLGEEFGIGPVDGAHELALDALADALQAQAPRYKPFGNYLQKATQTRIDDAFGQAGMKRRQVTDYLDAARALDHASHPHGRLHLALAHRREVSPRCAPPG